MFLAGMAPCADRQVLGTVACIAPINAICGEAAAFDPIVAVRGAACERLLRRIPIVLVSLLELNSKSDAAGEVGAVQSPGNLVEYVNFHHASPKPRTNTDYWILRGSLQR